MSTNTPKQSDNTNKNQASADQGDDKRKMDGLKPDMDHPLVGSDDGEPDQRPT